MGSRDNDTATVDHLVFLGAGALWPSYSGVLEELVRRRRLRRLRTVVGVSAGSLSILMLAIACTKSAQDAVATFRYLSRVIDTRHTMFASGGPDPVEQVELATAPHSGALLQRARRAERDHRQPRRDPV